MEDMWEYISGSFLPNLYAVPQEADSSQSYPPLCADGVTFPIGLSRLRQIRNNPSKAIIRMGLHGGRCISSLLTKVLMIKNKLENLSVK